MMGAHKIYSDNHFITYVNQIIIPYSLYTLYRAVSQLYLNKTGRKKRVYTRKSKVKNKNDKYHFMPTRMAKKRIHQCEASARRWASSLKEVL